MLWMSGNSVQIFSIIITVMLLWNSGKAMIGVNNVFKPYYVSVPASTSTPSKQQRGTKTPQPPKNPLFLPKVAYVLFQCALFGMGLYKCGGMGLLPTATSDWLAFMEGKMFEELIAL
jgi:ER membrane protein complex subunit 4